MWDTKLESFNYESRTLPLRHLFSRITNFKMFKSSRHIVKLVFNLKIADFKVRLYLKIVALL
jgi:hypothetical protein